MAVKLKESICPIIKKTRCKVVRPSDCIGQIYTEIPPVIVPCGTITESGGPGVTRTKHGLGSISGLVNISFEAFTVPDQMDVYVKGVLVATTGRPVGTSLGDTMPWLMNFNYIYVPGEVTYCVAVVTGPSGTAWEYTIDCPVP